MRICIQKNLQRTKVTSWPLSQSPLDVPAAHYKLKYPLKGFHRDGRFLGAEFPPCLLNSFQKAGWKEQADNSGVICDCAQWTAARAHTHTHRHRVWMIINIFKKRSPLETGLTMACVLAPVSWKLFYRRHGHLWEARLPRVTSAQTIKPAWRRPFTGPQTLMAHGAALNTVSTPWRVVSFSLLHILNILYQLVLYALYQVCIFILMHLNDLFDGLTILISLMQPLDNFATLVKPRESFSEFLLRKCLRSSLDIHIYIYIRRFRNVKYDIQRSMECSFFSF